MTDPSPEAMMPNSQHSLLVTAAIATLALTTPFLEIVPVTAHHGWSEYNSEKTLNLTGVVKNVTYGNPHATIQLETADKKVWQAILAPPSRMQSRGLPQKDLVVGQSVKLVGYPHRNRANEIRAERITVGDRTVELR
jgi:hypothetical protein